MTSVLGECLASPPPICAISVPAATFWNKDDSKNALKTLAHACHLIAAQRRHGIPQRSAGSWQGPRGDPLRIPRPPRGGGRGGDAGGVPTAVEQQAIQRAHRIGQTRAVHAVRFVTKDTIEERMMQLQEKKELVFQGTIDGQNRSLPRARPLAVGPHSHTSDRSRRAVPSPSSFLPPMRPSPPNPGRSWGAHDTLFPPTLHLSPPLCFWAHAQFPSPPVPRPPGPPLPRARHPAQLTEEDLKFLFTN